ncbi:MAG: dUTP diphosphatase [Cellvibrionaceae bacterium]
MILKVKRITDIPLPTFPAPSNERNEDAGYDLRAAGNYLLVPGARAVIPTGFAFEIPEGFYGRIAPRSGLAVSDGIDVLAGVVDSNYRDEVGVVLINHGEKAYQVEIGARIAQLIIEPYAKPDVEEVAVLTGPERKGGFGSTGR